MTWAGGVTYAYDANGNQISGDGRTIRYTVFDKADLISRGIHQTQFNYGIGNSRYQRIDRQNGSVIKTTTYLGSVEKIETQAETYYQRSIGGVALARYYPETGIRQVRYLLKDHLGSIYRVLDDSGGVYEEMSFSAFGERRNGENWVAPLPSGTQRVLNEMTTRGFTGHEHVDEMGIIHMNGRIYDAKLGRFLQADPIVQAPKNSQSLNRYSYVINNPLSYTDPSGFSFFKKWGRLIVAAVASYFTFGAASAFAWSLMPSVAAGVATTAAFTASTIIGAAAAGFVGGAIVSGSIRGALKGAFSGALFGGVAAWFGNTYSLARVATDSIAGGLSAEIYGESFRDGLFFAALVSSATYVTVHLRAYQLKKSAQFPGQIGESTGFRGLPGKVAGERAFEEKWIESGAAAAIIDKKPVDWVIENIYEPYIQSEKGLSPLGGLQGGKRTLFSYPYASDGLINYVLEGYSGVHDTLNQPYFYRPNGTNQTLGGFRRYVGRIINPANVLVASPVVIPALIPDHLRWVYFAADEL